MVSPQKAEATVASLATGITVNRFLVGLFSLALTGIVTTWHVRGMVADVELRQRLADARIEANERAVATATTTFESAVRAGLEDRRTLAERYDRKFDDLSRVVAEQSGSVAQMLRSMQRIEPAIDMLLQERRRASSSAGNPVGHP